MSSKFFPALVRALAAALAVAAPQVVAAIIAFFQGAPPSDISAGVWAVLSAVAVIALNWAVSKIPRPSA